MFLAAHSAASSIAEQGIWRSGRTSWCYPASNSEKLHCLPANEDAKRQQQTCVLIACVGCYSLAGAITVMSRSTLSKQCIRTHQHQFLHVYTPTVPTRCLNSHIWVAVAPKEPCIDPAAAAHPCKHAARRPAPGLAPSLTGLLLSAAHHHHNNNNDK